MSDPDQEEMRRKRLARLSALGGGEKASSPEKTKEQALPAVTPTKPQAPPQSASQQMEVDCQPSKLKGGASQVSLDFDSGIENMELDEASNGSPTKRNRTTSSANYDSTPAQLISSLQCILGVALPGAEGGPRETALAAPQASLMAAQLEPTDLVAAVLGEVTAGLPSIQEAVQYLVRCYGRQRTEEHSCGRRAGVAPLQQLLLSTRQQIVTCLALQLRSQLSPPATSSPLYSLLAQEQMPFDMTVSLVSLLAEDQASLAAVFSPLLQHCLTESSRHRSLTSPQHLPPLLTLTSLVKLRLPSGTRPLADLLSLQHQWFPPPLTPAAGLEVVALSYMGPFLAPSVFPEEDPAVAEDYFKELTGSGAQQQQQVKAAQSALQPAMELLRTQLHQMFHEVLANKASRGPLLAWLSEAVARNSKRTQLQANERLVAGDGFMLNLVSVLQHLCSKVKQDKVDAGYLHRPGCRIDISEDSRLKASSQEAKDWGQKAEAREANFPTECWFLTLQAHHVGVLPIVRRYQRRLRALRELAKMVEDLEKSEPAWRNHSSAQHNRQVLKKWKKQIKQQSKSKACADIGLLDEQLFSRCLGFYSSAADHMLRLLDPVQPAMPSLPLPQVAGSWSWYW